MRAARAIFSPPILEKADGGVPGQEGAPHSRFATHAALLKRHNLLAHGTYEIISARALWLDCQMVAATQRGSALHRTVGSR